MGLDSRTKRGYIDKALHEIEDRCSYRDSKDKNARQNVTLLTQTYTLLRHTKGTNGYNNQHYCCKIILYYLKLWL